MYCFFLCGAWQSPLVCFTKREKPVCQHFIQITLVMFLHTLSFTGVYRWYIRSFTSVTNCFYIVRCNMQQTAFSNILQQMVTVMNHVLSIYPHTECKMYFFKHKKIANCSLWHNCHQGNTVQAQKLF